MFYDYIDKLPIINPHMDNCKCRECETKIRVMQEITKEIKDNNKTVLLYRHHSNKVHFSSKDQL